MVGAAAPGPVVELAGDDKLVPSSWEPKRMSSRNRRRCIPVHDLAITVRTNRDYLDGQLMRLKALFS
jgi:hypothetical protein